MTMHCFCNYATCTCMRNSVRTAYIFVHVCRVADCVIRRLYAICTRIKIIYMCNNYVHVQPLCTSATIMCAYKNYVCVQQLCMRTTIMYSYKNVCVLRVKSSTLDHVRAQTYPRAYTSYRLAKCIAPPWKKLKWRPCVLIYDDIAFCIEHKQISI